MSTEENVHSGHRKRTIDKFLSYPESFCEHEILETILFYALPRIDTNALAHKLIKVFGSLENVFSASKSELKTIDGVGDKVASLLMIFGEVVKRCKKKDEGATSLNTPSEVKLFVEQKLRNRRQETFLLILLNKRHELIASLEFNDNHKEDVSAGIPEINQALLVHHPSFVIIAHNHPSGNVLPSNEDDLATKKICLICSLAGTVLIDHIIYGKGKFYGYHSDGRMEYVKNEGDVNKLLANIKENHYNGNKN